MNRVLSVGSVIVLNDDDLTTIEVVGDTSVHIQDFGAIYISGSHRTYYPWSSIKFVEEHR